MCIPHKMLQWCKKLVAALHKDYNSLCYVSSVALYMVVVLVQLMENTLVLFGAHDHVGYCHEAAGFYRENKNQLDQ